MKIQTTIIQNLIRIFCLRFNFDQTTIIQKIIRKSLRKSIFLDIQSVTHFISTLQLYHTPYFLGIFQAKNYE